jgi:hypothetical protein
MVRPSTGRSARLLFGVFAAPLGWVVQVAASFALTATSCFSRGVAKVGGVVAGASHAAMVVIALLSLALAIAGLVVAMRERRGTNADDARARHAARSRALADVGALSSVLVLAALAYSTAMLALSPHCPG